MYNVVFESPVTHVPTVQFNSKHEAQVFKAEHEHGKFAAVITRRK